MFRNLWQSSRLTPVSLFNIIGLGLAAVYFAVIAAVGLMRAETLGVIAGVTLAMIYGVLTLRVILRYVRETAHRQLRQRLLRLARAFCPRDCQAVLDTGDATLAITRQRLLTTIVVVPQETIDDVWLAAEHTAPVVIKYFEHNSLLQYFETFSLPFTVCLADEAEPKIELVKALAQEEPNRRQRRKTMALSLSISLANAAELAGLISQLEQARLLFFGDGDQD